METGAGDTARERVPCNYANNQRATLRRRKNRPTDPSTRARAKRFRESPRALAREFIFISGEITGSVRKKRALTTIHGRRSPLPPGGVDDDEGANAGKNPLRFPEPRRELSSRGFALRPLEMHRGRVFRTARRVSARRRDGSGFRSTCTASLGRPSRRTRGGSRKGGKKSVIVREVYDRALVKVNTADYRGTART